MSDSTSRTAFKPSEGRRYDHLYDPDYTLCSEADHVRANYKAKASTRPLRKIPKFESMFSNDPEYTFRLEPAVPVPSVSDYHWRGNQQQRKEALHHLAGTPRSQLWLRRNDAAMVVADYWKYLKRPSISCEQHFLQDGIFAFQKDYFADNGAEEENQPTHRTVAVQTDYRESETQTDPYSPEYVLQQGSTPSELLRLAAFTWGHGLPAGLPEVEMIERARAKRSWEASLPPLKDLKQLEKRRRRLKAKEAQEWAFREAKIQKLQEARQAVLREILMKKKEIQDDVTLDRLCQIYAKVKNVTEAKLQMINNNYMRSKRKLKAKRKNLEGKLQRDIVTASWTPKEMFTKEKQFKSQYVDKGLQVLDTEFHVLSKPRTTKNDQRPKDRKNGKESSYRTVLGLLNDYKAVKEEEREFEEKKKFRSVKEKPVPPPLTPRVEIPSEEDEQMELAVICLQRLLRGRKVEQEMFWGKENNMEIIQELRTVHSIHSEEQELLKAEKNFIMSLKKQRDEQNDMIAEREAAQAKTVGAELGQLFDTLSKELVRLQEERRIHAFTLLAERERRRREAEESGRRQVEERRCREEDEIFREVGQVVQESVDMFLEDVVLGRVDQVTTEQAREEIHRKAQELNDIVDAMEESMDSRQSEEIVSELVYCFLIPEVEKINIRQKVRMKQEKHLQAALSIIQEAGTSAGEEASQGSGTGASTSEAVSDKTSECA